MARTLGFHREVQVSAQVTSRADLALGRAGPRLPTRRDWLWWVAPNVSTLFASVAYVAILLLLATDGWAAYWGYGRAASHTPGGLAQAIGVILLLALVDRIEVRFFGQRPSIRLGVVFLIARIPLIVAVVRATEASHVGILLAMLLPFLASHQFGARGVYAIGAATLVVIAGVTAPEPMFVSLNYVIFVVVCGLVVLVVSTEGILVSKEQRSRQRAEMLLDSLQQSHADLQVSATEVLAATEERHQLAQQIHDQIGQSLRSISVHLDQALAFRAIEPERAEGMVREAKQQASEALQAVRRSVGALRAARLGLGEPRRWDELASKPDDLAHRPWWSSWLLPRTFDLVPTAVVLGFLGLSLAWSTPSGPQWSWLSAWFTLPLLGLIVVDRIEYTRFGEGSPARIRVAFVGVRLLLCATYGLGTGDWDMLAFLIPLVPYYVFVNFGRKWALGVLALTLAIYVGSMGWFLLAGSHPDTPRDDLITILAIALISALVVIATQMMLEERRSRQKIEQLLAELEDAHRQLQAYAAQAVAVNEERNHLAREIHDGLGHYLTVINVQLEKALAFRTVDPTVADRAIQDTQRLVGEALREVKGATGALALAPEGFSLSTALRQLVDNVRGRAAVDLRVDGQPDGFSPQTLFVLYRVAQEGLTNVQKHAEASKVRVALAFGAEETTLEVSDNGSGFELSSLRSMVPTIGARYGLRGVRERVELLGGELALASELGRGTTLRVVVPKYADPGACRCGTQSGRGAGS